MQHWSWRSKTKGILFNQSHFVKIMRLWVYSISASVIWETPLHSNRRFLHTRTFPWQLLQIPDPMKSRRCEIVSLENLTRVSGCQEGSMLSSSIAVETHVKVRSDQIKYSPYAFENLYDNIIYQILKQGLGPSDFAQHYVYKHRKPSNSLSLIQYWARLVKSDVALVTDLVIDPYDKILIW